MTALRRSRACLLATALLTGVLAVPAFLGTGSLAATHDLDEPKHSAALDDAIIAAAKRHGVPERLVRRIIMRESKYNARARNRAFWGLMQISYPTARSMGFKGTPEELLNPFVNLRFAVPYLANAFVIAGKDDEAAVRLYAAGYYFTARSKGLLTVLRTADSPPLPGFIDPIEAPVLAANAVAQVPQSIGIFGALFGPGHLTSPPADAPAPSPADAATTSVAAAAPTEAATPARNVTSDGKKDGGTTGADMVADASGSLEPPKKWKHDGGVTTIARGEQAIEQLADRADDGHNKSKSAKAHHAHKITLVASLDVPTSSQQTNVAQAYTAPAGQDPRLTGAPSQAAIADATSASVAPVALRTATDSAELPTQYDEPDAMQPAKAKPGKKLPKHHAGSDKKVRQAAAEREPLASGRSESR